MKWLSNLDWGNIAQWVAAGIALLALLLGPGIIRSRRDSKRNSLDSTDNEQFEGRQILQVGSSKIRLWDGIRARLQGIIQIGRPVIEIGYKKSSQTKKNSTQQNKTKK